MSSTRYDVRGRTAVITLDYPPINGLGAALRGDLMAALDRALADNDVKAVVVTGTERAFSGGADIKEFGSPNAARDPRVPALIAAFEDSPKPVVAAIAGVCMGGGLELALGAHYRVARADAQIALPEVKLGLLPGAGGTQRLPRAIGLEAALNMIVSGAAVPAAQAQGHGPVRRGDRWRSRCRGCGFGRESRSRQDAAQAAARSQGQGSASRRLPAVCPQQRRGSRRSVSGAH